LKNRLKEYIIINYKELVFVVSIVLLFSFHFSFLNADPNIDVSFSRGAWTDEGLYTSQVKNAIIKGEVDFVESSCMSITPLFSVINFMPYKVFGWSSLVSRLTVLACCFTIICFTFFKVKELQNTILFLIPILLIEEHIFHFLHYSLADGLATLMIFLGCHFLYKSIISQERKNCFYCTLFFTCSFLLKFQFFYVVLIIPTFLLLWFIYQATRKKKLGFSIQKLLVNFSIAIAGVILFYLLSWYLPNKEMINLVLENSTNTRAIQVEHLNVFGIIIDYLLNIKKFLILSIHTSPIVILSLFFIPLGIFFLFFSNVSRFFQINFLISISWIIVEMHKFSMNYLPTRYLLSLYFALGLLIAIVFYEVIIQFKSRKKYTTIVFYFVSLCLLTFSVNNFMKLKRAYDSRTFDIQKTNEYFSQYDYDHRPIMGSWASSLVRDAEVVTIPFFEDYINHKNIIKRFNPKVIIFEKIEENVLLKDNIAIYKIADSVISRKVGIYDLKIAWLP